MIIAILSNREKDPAFASMRSLCRYLLQHGGCTVCVPAEAAEAFTEEVLQPVYVSEEVLYSESDVMLVLGGDGSIIRAASRIERESTAILGINLGRVGFLAEAEPSQTELLDRLLAGAYTVQDRIMLYAIIHTPQSEDTQTTPCALNDIVVSNGTLSRMVEVELLCDGSTVQTYRADGLIVATPTGSTAYSMSAGGPILHPLTNCLCITPVCSHSLVARPLVVSGESEICIRNMTHGASEAFLSVDGYVNYPLAAGATVTVRKASKITRLIHFEEYSFYDILHRKFADI